MIKTFTPKAKTIDRSWDVLDAKDQILGRLATQAATLLMGKHKPDFSRHLDTGDHVIILNAESVATTGNKASTKVYTRHSGYPGGLRQTTFAQMGPQKVIIHAVSGMLPKNKLQASRLKRLHVVIGPDNPYAK